MVSEESFSCNEDPRFVRSFLIGADAGGESALRFYREHGFVVFRNVFTKDECQQTCDAMWSFAEDSNPGFLRSQPSTWDKYQASGKYGLSLRGPSFDPVMVDNRQNKNLAAALSLVLEIPVEDVMVGHDRFTIYRATELEDSEYLGNDPASGGAVLGEGDGEGESKVGVGSKYLTGRKNVHLDLNPWWWLEASQDILVGANSLQYDDPQDFIKENNFVVSSMGPHVQCVLNFADNMREDGGTIVVPGFHAKLSQWCEMNKSIRKPVPFVTLNDKNAIERTCEHELLKDSVRVSMRAGSVLIWNQTLAHGTQPNKSRENRMAQFLKAFSRSHVFSKESRDRLIPLSTVLLQQDLCKIECEKEVEAKAASGAGKGEAKTTSKTQSKKGAAHKTEPPQPLEWDGPARLSRRAESLKSQLQKSGSLDLVTPLGRTLFGLNIEESGSVS